ncbi:hypothetical protein CDAR_429961 [Caerostris darwini]|uniref:Uncharacterized protein n=1 Tax=Caerostris darwini TaxID=1538125 RepID=A0AAV4RUI7_9ARAC|nr:hypothetical protein CDAR_429961 [Caerostris darwini]
MKRQGFIKNYQLLYKLSKHVSEPVTAFDKNPRNSGIQEHDSLLISFHCWTTCSLSNCHQRTHLSLTMRRLTVSACENGGKNTRVFSRSPLKVCLHTETSGHVSSLKEGCSNTGKVAMGDIMGTQSCVNMGKLCAVLNAGRKMWIKRLKEGIQFSVAAVSAFVKS